MNKKVYFLIGIILVIAVIITSCSNSKDESELVNAAITYKDIAKDSDFEKYHNVYSPEIEIELERDNYYLIKVICTVNNGSSKNLSGLDFVSYNDKILMYESGAIDIAPTYPINPNSVESFDAYIYVDKSLDNEEKITAALSDTTFDFQAYLYDTSPVNSTKINFNGNFENC